MSLQRRDLWGPAAKAAMWSARRLGRAGPVRRTVLRACERRLVARATAPGAHVRHPPAVQADRLSLSLAMLRIVDRVLAEDRLGDAAFRGMLQRLIHDVQLGKGAAETRRRFVARHGASPPAFMTLSPGKTCNLRCVGCYADSGPTREKLEWSILNRVVREARDEWGMRFFVISGGEPLAYRDEGKGVLDLAESHPDCFFLMYSNGTLITDEVARRMAQLGNVSPGLSIEGGRERTDARRGAGVFDKVLEAMTRLRREGVMFGLSLTATRENADEILDDGIVNLFFEEMGALYAWVFHYMPIGRAPSLALMPTPEQRVRLFERVWHLVRQRRYLIVDFWNSATASNGCIAGARPGGYLYVDWNGAVCPCVFVPYSPVNLRELYAAGGTLDDVWREPFFRGVRDWQRAQGYREEGEPYAGGGNWMMPCLIRDHHRDFRKLVLAHRPRPVGEDARAALEDPGYARGLEDFDRRLAGLTDPLWESCYLGRAETACRLPTGRSQRRRVGEADAARATGPSD